MSIFWITAAIIFIPTTIFFVRSTVGLGPAILAVCASAVISALLSVVVLFLGWTIIVATLDYSADRENPIDQYEICAIQDSSNTYIGRSYYDNGLTYNVLRKTDQGLVVESLEADEAYVQYDENPRVIVYGVYPTNNFFRKIFNFSIDEEYDVYIPKDSIITDYHIDLQ